MLQSTLFACTATVLFMAAAAVAQEDCPNPAIECPDNCGGAQCGRFLNAECRENPCHGLCTPNFFRKGRNVTDRCDVERCGDKDCPGERQCIEETVPASCPGGRPQCRQYIRARCVLPPPPTDCSQISCGPGMFCRERKRGEGVTCARARNCDQLTCDEGLACTETEEGPMCVREQPTTPPSITPTTAATALPNICIFCERLGQVCEVVNGTYQCVDPTECIPIRVDYCLNTLGQLCEEIDGKAECVFAENCNVIECPRGTICDEIGTIAFCTQITMAESCDQLNCERLGQVCEQQADSAVCVVGCTDDDIEFCEQINGRCGVVDGIAQCVRPSTCDEIECDVGFRCIIIEGGNGTQDFPICIEETKPTCEETVCAEGSTCVQLTLPSRNVSLAQCVVPELIDFFPTLDQFTCAASGGVGLCEQTQICADVHEDGRFLTFTCNNVTVDCRDDSSCALNEVCADVPNDLGVQVDFTTVCIPGDESIFEFSGGCDSDSKQCPPGLVCQDIVFTEGVTIGTTCGVSSPSQIGSSCAELACLPPLECVESIVTGKGGIALCADKQRADSLLEIIMSLI